MTERLPAPFCPIEDEWSMSASASPHAIRRARRLVPAFPANGLFRFWWASLTRRARVWIIFTGS